jgi:hypothetical protein
MQHRRTTKRESEKLNQTNADSLSAARRRGLFFTSSDKKLFLSLSFTRADAAVLIISQKPPFPTSRPKSSLSAAQ